MKKRKPTHTKKRISILAVILAVILFAIGFNFVRTDPWIALEYYSSKVQPTGKVISKERIDLGSYQNPKRGSISVKSIQYIFSGTGNLAGDVDSVTSQLMQHGWREFDRWSLDTEGNSFGANYVKDGTDNPVQVRVFVLNDEANIVVPPEAINKTNTTINLDYGKINKKYSSDNGYKIGLLYFTGRP